jgi:cell division protein ZapE
VSNRLLTRYNSQVDSGELDNDLNQKRIVDHLNALCDQLKDYEGNGGFFNRLVGRRQQTLKGAYIYGGVGRGKSMLMDLFFEVLECRYKKRVHFHEFMGDVHAAIHEWRQHHKAGKVDGDDPIAPVAEKIAGEAKVLCFDEFIVNDITDAMILGRLFSVLFEKGVIVIATSNREPDTLYENGLNRALFLPFIEVLKQRLDILHLDHSIDYRMMHFEGLTTYYTPLGTAADNNIQHAWERLTGKATGARQVLKLLGRNLVVPSSAHGVARFGFEDLCEKPLGALDYLKLARVFHTVILERVPQLSADRRNEARRFIILVDTLYDNGVKMVISAAAPPNDIYLKGKERFEFDRTVSRLLEMQSPSYLGQGHGDMTAICVPSVHDPALS